MPTLSRPLRLLMIGPRTVTDDGAPTPIGGMIVLFEELVAGVQAAQDVQVDVKHRLSRLRVAVEHGPEPGPVVAVVLRNGWFRAGTRKAWAR